MIVDRNFSKALLVTVSVGALVSTGVAIANPLDPNVVEGNVTFEGLGTGDLVVENNSLAAIVDWDSFSIGTGEVTTINQITDTAAILNRVTGDNVSEIYGTLRSNGQVYLINQSGIVVGQSGVVDTNGFVASTLDVSNAEFLAGGDMVFRQGVDVGGGIEIHGKIRSVSGGDIFLLSREITIHEGAEVSSNGGYVGLGAGEEILLRPVDSGEGRISIRAGSGKIKNSGAVEAAVVELRAAGGNEYALAINNTGVIRATRAVKTRGGRVLLSAGGTVKNSGKIYAKRKVVVRSKKRIINSGTIKLPQSKPSEAEIILDAPEIVVEAGSVLDVSAALGGGRIYVGGGYQGSNAGVDGNAVDISQNATNVTVEKGAVLRADALESGDAGEIVVWSDGATTFAGEVSASSVDGKGGFAEISGKRTLDVAGLTVNLRGGSEAGTLLLDPEDILISSATPTGQNVLLDSDIQTILDGGANVIVNTSTPSVVSNPSNPGDFGGFAAGGNAGDGDVTFEAGVRINWTGTSTFEVRADDDIIALDDIVIQRTQNSASDQDGEAGDGDTFISHNDAIRFSAGGDINIGGASNRTGDVYIGAEFGSTVLVAGDTDGDFALTATDMPNASKGNITILGGVAVDDMTAHSTQIGYRVDAVRGADNSGQDYRTDSGDDYDHARNGDIVIRAIRDVTVKGAEQTDAGQALSGAGFAQIGHGGETGDADTSGYDIVNASISIEAGRASGTPIAGSVNVDGGSNEHSFAQIGHGVYKSDTGAIAVGDISGDITVVATDDVKVNTASLSETTDANGHDKYLAQIGHGAHLFYSGAGQNGVEVSVGRIAGDISVEATDDLVIGNSLDLNNTANRVTMLGQIGHGAYVDLAYDGSDVAASSEIAVTYGAIANFEDISGAEDGDGHGTDISIFAGSVTLTAENTTRNSAGASGDLYDNKIRNQIGHGSYTNHFSGATVDQVVESINGGAALPTAQASGNYTTFETVTENNVGTGAAAGVAVSDLSSVDVNSLSPEQASALQAFLATNPADDDIVPATVDNVTITREVNNSSVDVNLDALVTSGSTLADALNTDTSGWTIAQQQALAAFVAANTSTSNVSGTPARLNAGQLNITVTEDDIAGNIKVYDTDASDQQGITLTSSVSAGLYAITNDVMANRIGHATSSHIVMHDGNDMTDGGTNLSNDAGTVTISQANILGADIVVDTLTQGTSDTADDASEADNQDISLITSIQAGLARVENNIARSDIGHGGELALRTGMGGDALAGNNVSGHGGDINVIRGTIWDGVEHYNGAGSYDNDETDIAGDYSYGGSVNITLTSSDQVIVDNDVKAALARAEANNAISQIGSGSYMILMSGDGGSTSNAGSGGRGGDISVEWDTNEYRDYGHGDQDAEDHARGLMGDITIRATHDGTLTGDELAADKDGYALAMTSTDSAALSKADHNMVTGQIGHADLFELISGNGGDGGDLDTATGQTNGGRGGNIDVQLSDMKIESDLLVDIQGAILSESIAINALSPQSHGLVETLIGHGSKAYAVAGDGGTGGVAANTATVTGFDPDTGNDGSADSTLRDSNGEILRGGAVGGDGGDITIALGDITDRYVIDNNGAISYHHDGNADLHKARASEIATLSVSGDSASDIVVYATHNESMDAASDKARSVYLHAQTVHGLSEGTGSEVNAQIGHAIRMQAQAGAGGNGGSHGGASNSQVNIEVLQQDMSGGNGGDVALSNGNIIGAVRVEAERQVELFTQAGHLKETIVTTSIGHNTQLVAVAVNGGNGGDLSQQQGDTDNGITEYDSGSFVLTLQDLNKDDSHRYEDDDSAQADNSDNNSYSDDGIGIQSDGDNSTSFDRGVQTASHGLLNDGVDTDLSGLEEVYQSGVDPDETVVGGDAGSAIQDAMMVYDHNGNPQFIQLDDGSFVANTDTNRNNLPAGRTIADGSSAAFVSNVDNQGHAEFTYDSSSNRWSYHGSSDVAGYNGDTDSDRNFTYVDLNRDGNMDLVDFDQDGRFDIVDIDQNGVLDQIDGRVATSGTDNRGNANIIDYAVNTGMNFDPAKTEGGWSVADLSHANGGRGGDASVQVGYSQGDVIVRTGNVNFAENEAYNGAAATGVTDSLLVHTDIQDNIVSTGGIHDVGIARLGHGAVQIADTAASYSNEKVGRLVFLTETDNHSAASGGDAGQHALNASGGDGGDVVSIMGAERVVQMNNDGSNRLVELDHLVGDILVNDQRSARDGTKNDGAIAAAYDPDGDGNANESTANRVVVSSKVDNAKGSNIGIAQIGHGSISWVDASAANGGDGMSGDGSELEAHQTEIANGGNGGDANSTAHHIKGDIQVYAGRAPDPAREITSIDVIAEEGSGIVPGSSDDIVIAQIGHGRIADAKSGNGGQSDDAQWIANGGRGGDAASIQREILDTSIIVNSASLLGHGMDVLARAYQGSGHIVRAQVGMGDLNFVQSGAGGDGAQSASSVREQWNQQVNGGRGGDAIALQAGYQYDVTVDVGSAPDTTDADKASLRVMTDAQNIFLGGQNHILATIGHGGYSHADSTAATGGNAGTRSTLSGIATSGETPFSTHVSYRNGGRGGNAISYVGVDGTGRSITGREDEAGFVVDGYVRDDADGADVTVRTHDLSYDSDHAENSLSTTRYGRYDGIKIEALAGPGDTHERSIDTNTAQIGHSSFNRADSRGANGGDGIQSTYSANIVEGNGGNGGDAYAYTGSVNGDILVTNVVTGEANDALVGGVLDGGTSGDSDTNIVLRATGGTVSSDHRADARIGHNLAAEAVTDSNGGHAAQPPRPNISFIAAISSRGGAAGDASSIQGALSGDVTVTAENSIIVDAKKTTLASDQGFFAGIGHRLENDVEALGEGGKSGLLSANGVQAWIKDDGNDNNDDATNTQGAGEEQYLLSTYQALYELKQRMNGNWDADGAEDYKTAYNDLSPYEQSLVAAVLGNPNAEGEGTRSLLSETASHYTGTAEAIHTPSATKSTPADTDIAHRFAGDVNNEGYGSGKDVADILNTLIFGRRDNDNATNGQDDVTTAGTDESRYGNIPAPSADEVETLRFLLASSGDGGSVRSYQDTINGDITLTANGFDADNSGADNSIGNARGIYISSNDAALSSSDMMAVVGHGIELIKARAGNAGLTRDPSTQTTAAIGGDGGDALIIQGGDANGLDAISGDITLNSAQVIEVTAINGGLGVSEEDTRIGHQLKIGSMLEDFDSVAAVVAGRGGQDEGISSDGRNGNGGDITIQQAGADGAILLTSLSDVADGEGLSGEEVAIRIFADNNNISADDTEVHIGHDQTVDSARAGDAGRHNALTSFDPNKGLISVMEGKGGDITLSQAALQGNVTVSAIDRVDIKSLTANGGNTRTLLGHDMSAGKEWQDGELDNSIVGNRLIAGLGGDSMIEDFDDVAGGEADGGTVTVTQGSEMTGQPGRYRALAGDVTVTSTNNNVVINANSTLGGAETFVALGHQMKLSALAGDAGVHQGITPQTAGDGGDILITRGLIDGNVAVTASGAASTGNDLASDGEILVEATNSLGSETEILLGHTSESILTAGRSGFSQEYVDTNYDGVDTSSGSATAATTTIRDALDAIALSTIPNGDSVDSADLTNIDKRDAIRLIENVKSMLEMALQYSDRMTADEQTNLQTALTRVNNALTLLGTDELATVRSNDGTIDAQIVQTYQNVITAAGDARDAIDLALGDSSDHGLRDADTRTGSDVFVKLFADHVDAGDIRINMTGDSVGNAEISGNVTLTGNATAGVVSLVSDAPTGIALVELGHRAQSTNSTQEGAGERDGSSPNGGIAGDGGSIFMADSLSGNVAVSADEIVITSQGAGSASDVHLGHNGMIANTAQKADIFNSGMGNGGQIQATQTFAGNVSLSANHVSDTIDAENGILTAQGSLQSTLRFGHLGSSSNESYSDNRTTADSNSEPFNRAGDIEARQIASGDVTFNLDLDGDGIGNDLLLVSDNGSAISTIQVGHDMTQLAHSGITEGNDGDGQMVTAYQNVSGNVTFSNIEDLVVRATGSAANIVNIGHDAANTAWSGQVGDSARGDDYGERVDADQLVSGAIGLTAERSVTIEAVSNSSGRVQVGHSAELNARSADDGGDFDTEEGYRDDANNLMIADVDADQTVTGRVSITTGEIIVADQGSSEIQLGHDVSMTTDTDDATGDRPGHIEANSVIGGVNGEANITLTANAQAIRANGDNAHNVVANGSITMTMATASGDAQIGHRAATTTGHDETSRPDNGSVDLEQSILSDLSVNADEDLIMSVDANGGHGQLGHRIDELNEAMGTSVGEGHENTYLDAAGQTQVSDATQRVNGDVTVNVGDSLSMVTASGDLRIGHASSDDNVAQLGISDQQLIGDITVTVGTEQNGTADGQVAGGGNAADNDDALLSSVAGGTVDIGHDHAEGANNEVQISSGNIWVAVGADLHALAGSAGSTQIGHEHYDFDALDLDAENSFDLDATKTAALSAGADLVADDGLGTIRNRVQGSTSIGVAQNNAVEDSIITADVLVLNNADVNSGYGGKGDRDVDGALRFFMSAQENLTIAGTVRFNDSASSGDVTFVRQNSADNIFEGDGGVAHEHDFELMSLTADYRDDVIGDGNFGFYFDQPVQQGASSDVYIPLFGFQRGFSIAYNFGGQAGSGSKGAPINIGRLAGNVVVGTGSADIICEESNSEAGCDAALVSFPAVGGGLSSMSSLNAGHGSFDLPSRFPVETGTVVPLRQSVLEEEMTPSTNQPLPPQASRRVAPPQIQVATVSTEVRSQLKGSLANEEPIVIVGTSISAPTSFVSPREGSTGDLSEAANARTNSRWSGQQFGYGQAVTVGVKQSDLISQLGLTGALSSASSYSLFATEDS